MNKKERARTFNLVINKNADCYNNIAEIVANLNNIDLYAYILHDKDTDEAGNIKEAHYHLYLKFINARTCESIMKQFKGAHVEIPINETQSIKYLLHATKNAAAQGKHKYAMDELLCNNYSKIEQILKEDDYPIFVEEEIPTYIAKGIVFPFTFLCYFGKKQYNTNRHMYNEILISYKNQSDPYLERLVNQAREHLQQQETCPEQI